VAQFHYVRPTEPVSSDARRALEAAVPTVPTLAVLDGVTEAMDVHGLSLESNTDVATFLRRVARPIAEPGSAVVLVDHVTKSRDGRGRWAIGGQHKLAGLDGIARIGVAKDRPGRVREHATGEQIAELHLWSAPDGRVTAALEAPEGSSADRPTVLMQRISDYLATVPAPGLTTRALEEAVKGNNAAKRLALELLIAEGNVRATRHGNAVQHELVRPFGVVLRLP
jgi:hypothetical protein